MNKKILSVFLAAAMMISCVGISLSASAAEAQDEIAQAVTEELPSEKSYNYNGITYKITLGGKICVTGYSGDSSTVVIPDQIDGKPVTEISSSVFKNQTGLKSVTLPYGITEIGASTFENCSSLEKIIIPGTVTSIGKSAFKGCSCLMLVTLSERLEKIGESAFEDCIELETIFIPNGVSSIGKSAFKNCSALRLVTLSDSLKEVNAHTFQECINLETIVIPDSVKKIYHRSFENCTRLKNAYIPESVTFIGLNAFDGCSRLTIYGRKNTAAEKYAVKNTIPFRPYPSGASGVVGDVDGDGLITANDSLLVLRYSVKLEDFDEDTLRLADVNGDGNVDSFDSLVILRYSVGIKDSSILMD